jgi:cell division protein FtsQ
MSTTVRSRPLVARIAERRKSARRRRWLQVALVVVVVLGIIGVAAAALFTPVLGVRSIEVVGLSTLTQDEVVDSARLELGDPMLLVDPGGIHERVSSIPEVASVHVVRKWPSTVRIEIRERVAVALVAVGENAFRAVDASGHDFAAVEDRPAGLPLIAIDPQGIDTAGRIKAAVDVVLTLPEYLRLAITSVSADSPDDVRFMLTNGDQIRWGSPERADDKAAALAVLVSRTAAVGQDVAVYDVSSPEVPTTS